MVSDTRRYKTIGPNSLKQSNVALVCRWIQDAFTLQLYCSCSAFSVQLKYSFRAAEVAVKLHCSVTSRLNDG